MSKCSVAKIWCKNKNEKKKDTCPGKPRMLIHKSAYVKITNGIKIHHYCYENHPEKTEISPKNDHIALSGRVVVENDYGSCDKQCRGRGWQPFEESRNGILIQGEINKARDSHDCVKDGNGSDGK